MTRNKKKQVMKRDEGHLPRCIHCGRKHQAVVCYLVNHTYFRCHQYGHFVDKCPFKAQGTSGHAEPSSRSAGYKRAEPKKESDISEEDRLPKNSRHI